MSDAAPVQRLSDGDRAVLFVPGLTLGRTDPLDAWSREGLQWPRHLAEQHGWQVLLSGYDRQADSLTAQARALLTGLYETWQRPQSLVVVAHSVGGLLVKRLVAMAAADRTPGGLLDAVSGVAFLGTPHRGDVVRSLRRVARPVAGVAGLGLSPVWAVGSMLAGHSLERHTVWGAVKALDEQKEQIREDAAWYREHSREHGIETLAITEGMGVRLLGVRTMRVVWPDIADPGVTGATVREVPHDHFSMARPALPRDAVVTLVEAFCEDRLRLPGRWSGLRHQAGAVCWRRGAAGEPEFLLVRTSAGRWTFPKGNAEPGEESHEAAAREAREEAGVLGTVGPDPVGVYLHAKQDQKREIKEEIAVTAHLLGVEEQTADHERDRDPTWFGVEDAAAALREDRLPKYGDELARIVRAAAGRLTGVRADATERPQ